LLCASEPSKPARRSDSCSDRSRRGRAVATHDSSRVENQSLQTRFLDKQLFPHGLEQLCCLLQFWTAFAFQAQHHRLLSEHGLLLIRCLPGGNLKLGLRHGAFSVSKVGYLSLALR